MTDKFYNAIVSVVKSMKGSWSFKELYEPICRALGATDSDAKQGCAPCPYKGLTKDMKGLIRSWIEERCPDSRQYYFRAGRLTSWRGSQPLLFVNPGLGMNNRKVAWAPYNHVRGMGWAFNPDAAKAVEQPSQEILNAAAALYKKRGMQGKNRTISKIVPPSVHVHVPAPMPLPYATTGCGGCCAVI